MPDPQQMAKLTAFAQGGSPGVQAWEAANAAASQAKAAALSQAANGASSPSAAAPGGAAQAAFSALAARYSAPGVNNVAAGAADAPTLGGYMDQAESIWSQKALDAEQTDTAGKRSSLDYQRSKLDLDAEQAQKERDHTLALLQAATQDAREEGDLQLQQLQSRYDASALAAREQAALMGAAGGSSGSSGSGGGSIPQKVNMAAQGLGREYQASSLKEVQDRINQAKESAANNESDLDDAIRFEYAVKRATDPSWGKSWASVGADGTVDDQYRNDMIELAKKYGLPANVLDQLQNSMASDNRTDAEKGADAYMAATSGGHPPVGAPGRTPGEMGADAFYAATNGQPLAPDAERTRQILAMLAGREDTAYQGAGLPIADAQGNIPLVPVNGLPATQAYSDYQDLLKEQARDQIDLPYFNRLAAERLGVNPLVAAGMYPSSPEELLKQQIGLDKLKDYPEQQANIDEARRKKAEGFEEEQKAADLAKQTGFDPDEILALSKSNHLQVDQIGKIVSGPGWEKAARIADAYASAHKDPDGNVVYATRQVGDKEYSGYDGFLVDLMAAEDIDQRTKKVAAEYFQRNRFLDKPRGQATPETTSGSG